MLYVNLGSLQLASCPSAIVLVLAVQEHGYGFAHRQGEELGETIHL